MTRDDEFVASREFAHTAIAVEHGADVEDDRERAPVSHVLVEVTCVRREHEPSLPCPDADHLQAIGMTADVVNGESRCELASPSWNTARPACTTFTNRRCVAG